MRAVPEKPLDHRPKSNSGEQRAGSAIEFWGRRRRVHAKLKRERLIERETKKERERGTKCMHDDDASRLGQLAHLHFP